MATPERIFYDEFSMFHENAEEFGLPYDGPPVVQREFVEVAPGRRLSALRWGAAEPELVLLHGGAQNAHTWDTVAMAIGRPLLAIDLPGHGHSDLPSDRADGPLSSEGNAADVAAVVRALAPNARAVVGMSLGGITAIALSGIAAELVRALVLVDITPGVTGEKSQAISNFVNGPRTFASFDDLLARTIEHNPTRTVSSLRRGILHNALQLDDGSWVWRYRRYESGGIVGGGARSGPPDYGPLWDILGRVSIPVLLVRGMRPQSVVDDADEERFVATVANGRVERVAEAGHSVQGDTPVELARLIEEFVW